jgi:hypothetical protein
MTPIAKRRPDLESAHLKAYSKLSEYPKYPDPKGGALFGLGALFEKCTAHFWLQRQHHRTYDKTETRSGIRAVESTS